MRLALASINAWPFCRTPNPQKQPTMKTAPVTTKAITARINRKLKPDFKMLRKTRGRMMQSNFGQFHVIDLRRNRILDAHVDPEAYARELGVMRGWEFIEDEDTQRIAA
jgi:hypothetical protein